LFLSFYVIVDGINIWIKQTLFPSDSKTAAKTIKYRKFLSCDLYRTRGDGNCLYRACSKLLCGKEDLCDLLRDLTSIELFSNQEFYAFHPYVKEKSHVFQSDNTAFSATASDSALGDGYDRKDPSSRVTVVKREAIRNATGGTYASLTVCVYLACLRLMEWVLLQFTQKRLGRRPNIHNFKMELFGHGYSIATLRVNLFRKLN
jgi:hypothetical protein